MLFFPLAALLVLWAAPVGWSQPESTGEFILTAGYATAVLGGVAWLVTYDPGELRRRRRVEANRCPSCGYSRDGLGSMVCPERGEAAPDPLCPPGRSREDQSGGDDRDGAGQWVAGTIDPDLEAAGAVHTGQLTA